MWGIQVIAVYCLELSVNIVHQLHVYRLGLQSIVASCTCHTRGVLYIYNIMYVK